MLASCTYFSVASDGSTDTAQLLLNVPAVNSNFELTQEFTGLASLQGCTPGLDIFYFRFLVHASLAKVRIIILSAALECAKKSTLWALAKKGCAPLLYIGFVWSVFRHINSFNWNRDYVLLEIHIEIDSAIIKFRHP